MQPTGKALPFGTPRFLRAHILVARDNLSNHHFWQWRWIRGEGAGRNSLRRWMNGDVGRLNASLRPDEAFEDAVDHVEDGGVASEVGGEAAFHAVLGFN